VARGERVVEGELVEQLFRERHPVQASHVVEELI
jgi:hypothetical protein